MVHCIRTIAAQEGVPSLWKGLTPFLGQLTLKYALRMGSNAFFLELMRDKVGGDRTLLSCRGCLTWLVARHPCEA